MSAVYTTTTLSGLHYDSERNLHYNTAENEIRYIIVTATERVDRGECHIEFSSLTFQNSEEVRNKSPKCRFMNKKIV